MSKTHSTHSVKESDETAKAAEAKAEESTSANPLNPSAIAAPKAHADLGGTIPKVEPKLPLEVRTFGQPPADKEYTKGIWTNKNDGEKYALATLEESAVENNKTHFAKNNVHFWNGTEAEFRATFDKE